jgi:hypothetical protein
MVYILICHIKPPPPLLMVLTRHLKTLKMRLQFIHYEYDDVNTIKCVKYNLIHEINFLHLTDHDPRTKGQIVQ